MRGASSCVPGRGAARRPLRRRARRPAGPEDPHRSIRDGQGAARRRRRIHARRLARGRMRATSARWVSPTRSCRSDVLRRRRAAAQRRPDQPAGDVDRRAAHQHPGAGRRRARQQQGHQPPGRRPVGGRADRQGPRGHSRRRRPQGRLSGGVLRRATRADMHEARTLAAGGAAGTRCWWPRSSAPRRSRIWPTWSRRATPSWWRAAISASRWAMRSLPGCKSRSSRRRATRTAW